MTVQSQRRWRRLPRPPGPERPRRRHRDHPRQGHRHRRLRQGLPGRDRAADHRRPHRDRQCRHLPPVRRGHQPARPAGAGGGKPLDEFIGSMQESGAGRKVKGAVSGAKKALSSSDDDDGGVAAGQEVVVPPEVHCMTPTPVAHDDVDGSRDDGRGSRLVRLRRGGRRQPDPGGLTGLDDQPVQAVASGRVAAVVSRFRSSGRRVARRTCWPSTGWSTASPTRSTPSSP